MTELSETLVENMIKTINSQEENIHALRSENERLQKERDFLRAALGNIKHSLRISWFTKENAQAIAEEALSYTQTKTEGSHDGK